MTITLLGQPKSTNHIYKYACRGSFPCMYMTAEGKALKEDYQWQAKGQVHGEPLRGRLKVVVSFFFATRAKRDLDNHNKLFLDALSGIAWEDDSQIDELTLSKAFDRENPRIEIVIEEKLPAIGA